MYDISKEFDCCYGHRVYTQELDKEYSIDDRCKCRHLHGHQGKIIVHLKAETLTNSMVIDFNMINWFKKFVDDVIDHKFLVAINDPFLTSFIFNKLRDYNEQMLIPNGDECYYRYIDPLVYKDAPLHEQEIYEGLIIVPFVPTAENFSEWIYNIVADKMKPLQVTVHKVTFYETPKCQSTYKKSNCKCSIIK